jgi:signal transduction histidine kinase
VRKSLTARIVGLSIIWIIMALVITTLILGRLYRDHIEEHFDAHVFTHVEELVAAVETGPDGKLQMGGQPTDPRFYHLNSGWYWEVRKAGQVLGKSSSLGEKTLNLQELKMGESRDVQIIYGPEGEKLRAQIMEVSYPNNAGALTFVATAPDIQIAEDVSDFTTHIVVSFLVLGVGLTLAVIIQVQQALKPLKAIGAEISDIKAGRTKRLSQQFPQDVQPLVDEMNYLLDHNEVLLKRARNQLGDLAHAVKNPLTVIRNEARNLANEQGQLILDQSHVMASSIDHCLTRARVSGKEDMFGYRTPVKGVIEDLVFAVERIYHERGIEITLSDIGDCCFRGETQDVEEMAGNLIDNACKWASSQVVVSCTTDNERLQIVVEDDGPGIREQDLELVMRRGHKLDESKPGHGHGLGIVNDIASLYGGSLSLNRSSLGGLRVRLDLPAA